jgi:homoserine O-succinyltransferase
MPVVTDRRSPIELRRRSGETLIIALVNNMPDVALQATEKQYRELLNAASGKRTVVLKLFTFAEIARGDEVQKHLRDAYEPMSALWSGGFDGLIVTGAQPRTAALPDESYWGSLTRLVDWAEQHTRSTIWSCLAAHAAVLHLDGIARRRLRDKLSGVFGCKSASQHPMLSGMRTRWLIPHSRYNDLPESALVANGYQILSHSPDVGTAMFVKQRGRSLFVFLQGHPEHDARALFREFRRDSLRYLKRERSDYPPLPRGYFDNRTVSLLESLRERALVERDPELILDFSAAEAGGKFLHAWREPATRLYANWLNHLVQERVGERDRIFSYRVNRRLEQMPTPRSVDAPGPPMLARTEW